MFSGRLDQEPTAERLAHVATLRQLYLEGGDQALGAYASAVVSDGTARLHTGLACELLELYQWAHQAPPELVPCPS